MAALADYFRTLNPIREQDTEWGFVEYLLKVGLRSASVNLESLHALNEPAAFSHFSESYKGTPVLDSFVNSRELADSESNSAALLVQRGGRFLFTPDEPFRCFPAGNIRLPTDLRDLPDAHTKRRHQTHEFIYCKVAIGHALVLERTKLPAYDRGIPSGYDSIKVHTAEEEEDPTATTDPNYYYHEYFISDSARVLPLFVVRFQFDPEADRLKRNPLCENCGNQPASLYCVQDTAKLCDECDTEVHKQPVMKQHSRVSLSEVNDSIVKCRVHKDMPVQYLDFQTFQPVCLQCLASGNYSSQSKTQEYLVELPKAHRMSMTTLSVKRQETEAKRQKIVAQLEHIDERLHQVHANATKVEAEIKDILHKIITEVQEQTQRKLHLLLSDEAELKRQLHYYEWLDCFLKYQRDIVNPVEFMIAFNFHAEVLAEAPPEELDTNPIVLQDLKIVGDIAVQSEFEEWQ